jgi:hypothetical protein
MPDALPPWPRPPQRLRTQRERLPLRTGAAATAHVRDKMCASTPQPAMRTAAALLPSRTTMHWVHVPVQEHHAEHGQGHVSRAGACDVSRITAGTQPVRAYGPLRVTVTANPLHHQNASPPPFHLSASRPPPSSPRIPPVLTAVEPRHLGANTTEQLCQQCQVLAAANRHRHAGRRALGGPVDRLCKLLVVTSAGASQQHSSRRYTEVRSSQGARQVALQRRPLTH